MIISDSIKIQNPKINNNKLLRVCLERDIPFVSYQMPAESEVTTLIQHLAYPRQLISVKDITDTHGFVVAPFDESQSFPTLILEPDYIHTGALPVDEIIETLEKCNTFSAGKESYQPQHQASRHEFIAQVETIKQKIAEGVINKVVLSRITIDDKIDGVDLITLFHALCQSYPAAFVYLLRIPGIGCWMGASPEPLLLMEGDIAQTSSIAGTQLLGDKNISDVVWKAKELDEQGIVTGYIEDVLKTFEVNGFEKTGPNSYQAANLVHLKTQFDFDARLIKKQLGEFIDAFHPTPSVCGLPKIAAREIVLSVEKHNREYYSGFLGPVNLNDKTALFVNLRCMKVVAEGFAFFGGAGITKGSVPGKEWDEITHKFMTLRSFVNVVKTSPNPYEFSKTGS
jgi:isochorismate synthase